jgi:hypothetical protein
MLGCCQLPVFSWGTPTDITAPAPAAAAGPPSSPPPPGGTYRHTDRLTVICRHHHLMPPGLGQPLVFTAAQAMLSSYTFNARGISPCQQRADDGEGLGRLRPSHFLLTLSSLHAYLQPSCLAAQTIQPGAVANSTQPAGHQAGRQAGRQGRSDLITLLQSLHQVLQLIPGGIKFS